MVKGRKKQESQVTGKGRKMRGHLVKVGVHWSW